MTPREFYLERRRAEVLILLRVLNALPSDRLGYSRMIALPRRAGSVDAYQGAESLSGCSNAVQSGVERRTSSNPSARWSIYLKGGPTS
jgi:hypothetical protein